MARREWPMRLVCNHPDCTESVTYRFQTRRDLEGSPERRWYWPNNWRCYRHATPSEVLGHNNLSTERVLVLEQREYGRYFGDSGVVSGPGFKAIAADFPPGTKLVVTARLEFPTVLVPDAVEPEVGK